jgi:Tol biopolymer transport system component
MTVSPRSAILIVAALSLLAACSGSPQSDAEAPALTAPASTAIADEETMPTTATSAVSPTSATGTMVYSVDVDGNEDVYRSVFGEPPRRLTSDPAKEFDPEVSPDGRLIAYRRNVDAETDLADIWVMDRDGGNQRNLTNAPELSNWSPTWTPDGRIAFASTRGGGSRLELWLMNADGSGLHRVGEGWCEYPSAAPDGASFVCASSVGGAYDLVVVGLDGTRTALTNTPVTEFGPSWSPDGRWIAFSRDVDERWELVRIRPDGSDEAVIAPEGVFSAWSADGRLAWSGPGGINILDPEGSTIEQVDITADFISWDDQPVG